jgi:DNA-binding XRE family transcriptional regulator
VSGSALAVPRDDTIISAGRPLPRIKRAEPLEGRNALIEWKSGGSAIVDLGPAFVGLRIFAGVRDDDQLFRSLTVDEYGDALVFADGAELSAMWIEELAAASMTNAEFRAAMGSLRFTLDTMASRLGISRRLIASYRKDKPLPKVVALATRYLLSKQLG